MSSGATDEAARLSEVSRLATLLADQVLDAQITNRPVPDQQIRALLDAARILEAHGQARPPLLDQIVHEVRAPSPPPAKAAGLGRGGDDDVGRLAWMLRPFRSLKDRG